MYLGSVRFFRHLIIAVLLLLLILPLVGVAVMSIGYAESNRRLENAVAAMNSYCEKQDELAEEFERLSAGVRSQIALLQPQINVAINSQMSDFRDQLNGILRDQEQTQQRLSDLIRDCNQSGGVVSASKGAK